MKRIGFLVCGLLAVCQVMADDIRFVGETQDVVVKGEQFRVSYTVNTQKAKEFRAPDFTGFEVLYGPQRSTSMSSQYVNGKGTTTHATTFTYVLMATKEGTYKFAPATITVGGEEYQSNPLSVKVLPPDNADDASGSGGGQGTTQSQGKASRSSSTPGKVSDSDLFMTATLSKSNVYEQEAVVLTYKVYFLINLVQLNNETPDIKGVQLQEVELPQKKSYTMEHYKGRNYYTILWRQYVLFPQQSGKVEIPSLTFEGVVEQMVQNEDAFDDPFGFDAFFNGGTRAVSVKKNLVTPKLTLNVKPLPEGKPAGFSGAVGNFSISSDINKQELKTNDAVTLKLVISGTGNMKLIKTPEVNFPADFDVYDPKVDNQFTLGNQGQTGNKVIEYLAIPRHPGKFDIPAVTFSYFDTQSETYKTLATTPYTLNVEKGEGNGNGEVAVANYANKEDLKVLGSDVRFIKSGAPHIARKGHFLYGSMACWLWYVIPLLLFVGVMAYFRKQTQDNANLAMVRHRKANKVATRRMKNAQKLLQQGNNDAFYDEVLRALWGYIGDKLSLPVSQLSKDNIEEKLAEHNVDAGLTAQFMQTLNDCEFARYAPGNQGETMDRVYASAVNVISNMENSIKK